MAEKKEAANVNSIEALKESCGISDAVFEGAKAAQNWKSGKQVTEETFLNACTAFEEASIDGRTKREEAKG